MTPSITTISFKAAGGNNGDLLELSGLGAQRVSMTEPAGFEMARSGRTACGGITLIAGGIVPVVDLPTTTGPLVLFNSSLSGDGRKVLAVKRISMAYASGTLGAYGTTLFAGVTPNVLATPLTANGATNFRTGFMRGYGTPVGFIDVAKTIPAGTPWVTLGGIAHGAATTTSIGYSVDLSASPFIVPPLFALTVGAFGDTGTTAKWVFSLIWDEIEAAL